MKKGLLIFLILLTCLFTSSCSKNKGNNIKIELEDGRTIKVELYKDIAPITVEHFLSLVDNKQFDNTIFHRVIQNFMIQAGELVYDKENNSLDYAKETNKIKGEFSSNGVENNLKHEPGVISMARSKDPNSASNQFFICSATSEHLDGDYAAFGKVVDQESLNVVLAISMVQTTIFYSYEDFPVDPIVIKTITRY